MKTQSSGTKNEAQARVKSSFSSVPFRLLTTFTLRLRFPCGARITTMAMLAARTTALAYQGFMMAAWPV